MDMPTGRPPQRIRFSWPKTHHFSASGFPFVSYSRVPFGNFQLFFFKVKGKGIFPKLKNVGSAVLGRGEGLRKEEVKSSRGRGRRGGVGGREQGQRETPRAAGHLMSWLLLHLVCLRASCLGFGYLLTTINVWSPFTPE